MAFDCVVIDFGNTHSDRNLKTIKNKLPHAKIIPFVDSYHDIARSVVPSSRTEYLWLLSSKVDYNDFDFGFIPEQHQRDQLHTWSNPGQKEGDTFLFPKVFLQQDIRFLRDYRDVNYHDYDVDYDFDFYELEYDLENIISNLLELNLFNARYIRYHEGNIREQFYPSYWEDLKIYIDSATFYIPGKALSHIKTQIYDYPYLYTIKENIKQVWIFLLINGMIQKLIMLH